MKVDFTVVKNISSEVVIDGPKPIVGTIYAWVVKSGVKIPMKVSSVSRDTGKFKIIVPGLPIGNYPYTIKIDNAVVETGKVVVLSGGGATISQIKSDPDISDLIANSHAPYSDQRGVPLYVQATQPTDITPYVWIQI